MALRTDEDTLANLRRQRALQIIADLERQPEGQCGACRAHLSRHQLLLAWLMGFVTSPLCVPCLAAGLERDADEVQEELVQRVQRLDCWRTAWRWIDDQEEGGNRRE